MSDTTTLASPEDDVELPGPAAERPADPAPAAPPAAEERPSPEAIESHLWLRRADQITLLVLGAFVAGLMAWHYARLSGWGARPVEIERLESRQYEYRIDVNAATWVEWVQLPGVGETLAKRIIEDREANGPFRTVDELDRVKGIGPKTVENLRPWLTVREGAAQ